MVKAKQARANKVVRGAGHRSWRSALGLVLALSCLATHSGCKAYFLDARDFVVDLFYQPEPMPILKDQSAMGRDRIKALNNIAEPKENFGKQAEQDEVIEMLAKIATTDHEPLCRMQAIQTLGRFKDERAVEIIEKAFFAVQPTAPDKRATITPLSYSTMARGPFPPDVTSFIQQQALTSLAETKNPKGRDLLINVAMGRAKRPDNQSQQQDLDLRLAAVRGLGEYRDLADVTDALLYVLKNDKNVALRDRAHESLVHATGKELPPDAVAWEEFLHNSSNQNHAREHRPGLMQLMGWWR